MKLLQSRNALQLKFLHEIFHNSKSVIATLRIVKIEKSELTLHILYFHVTLQFHEKCPYLKFFWSVFSPNAGKYGPEKLRIRTLFTQCSVSSGVNFSHSV